MMHADLMPQLRQQYIQERLVQAAQSRLLQNGTHKFNLFTSIVSSLQYAYLFKTLMQYDRTNKRPRRSPACCPSI